MKINHSFFDCDFCLIDFRPLSFFVLLKTFLCFHGVEKGNIRLKWVNFSADKSFFTNKFWVYDNVDIGEWGSALKIYFFDVINVFSVTGESKQLAT